MINFSILEHLLHKSFNNNSKVVKLLGIDARELTSFEEKMDICTIDVIFVSLKQIILNIRNFLRENGDIVALIKPLFEAEYFPGKKLDFIHDNKILKKVLNNFIESTCTNSIYLKNIMRSPFLSRGFPIEFFIRFTIDDKINKHNFSKKINKLFK